jgi:hypothetical protein
MEEIIRFVFPPSHCIHITHIHQQTEPNQVDSLHTAQRIISFLRSIKMMPDKIRTAEYGYGTNKLPAWLHKFHVQVFFLFHPLSTNHVHGCVFSPSFSTYGLRLHCFVYTMLRREKKWTAYPTKDSVSCGSSFEVPGGENKRAECCIKKPGKGNTRIGKEIVGIVYG